MPEIIQKNIQSAELRTQMADGDITVQIDAVIPHPPTDAAYVISMPNTWEDLGTVPINDEIFETDSNLLKNQLAKMQFGMRLIRLPLQIVTPNLKNHVQAYYNRAELLHKLQKMMSNLSKYCELFISITIPRAMDYVIYCHPHGVDALHVTKLPYRYDVVLTLVAEDPLFYTVSTADHYTDVANLGDVPYFASITLEKPTNLQHVYCEDEDGNKNTMKFLTKVTSDNAIEIEVKYPGQICTINGATTVANIDVSGENKMFLPVPLGYSTWTRDDGSYVIVHTRTPLIGIPP